MKKIAIVTDSNSGISPKEAADWDVFVVPMPFIIGEDEFFEGVTLKDDKFYEIQASGQRITTSQPNINKVVLFWQKILKRYDQIVYIPMSSGLSQSCETAKKFAEQFGGRVQVVDNKRISVTLKASVLDALHLAKQGLDAEQIAQWLEKTAMDASIYITVDTLKFLKQGGRITPAAAAIGTVLNIKPILQIQGGKLDKFDKVTNMKRAKQKMMDALKKDIETRFAVQRSYGNLRLAVAHTCNAEAAQEFADELRAEFPDLRLDFVDSLSLSIAAHTGPKVLGCGCYCVID